MPDRDIRRLADEFLQEAVHRLSALSYPELAAWPEWPAQPDSGVVVPEHLAAYQFTVMKDTRPDGSVRIAIQRYRVGEMTADGFFIHPNGEVIWMDGSDMWEVT